MNIEFEAYKGKLNDLRPALDGLSESLNLEGMKNELVLPAWHADAPVHFSCPRDSETRKGRPVQDAGR